MTAGKPVRDILKHPHAIWRVRILRELAGVMENHRLKPQAEMFRDMLYELFRLKKSPRRKNNQDLKSKTKAAGTFRSDDGARWYLKIRSYIDSARKHGNKHI